MKAPGMPIKAPDLCTISQIAPNDIILATNDGIISVETDMFWQIPEGIWKKGLLYE